MNRLLIATPLLASVAIIAFLTLWKGPLDADVHTNEIDVGDITRTYRIVMPHEMPVPTPIVFAFHGIGDSTDSMASYSRLDRLAARKRFVLVYPEVQNSMWATINVDPSNLDANPDVRFFDKLLNHIDTVHEIDRNRVYLMGMSNGASLVHLLAAARSDQLGALVAHSGLRPKSLGEVDVPMPMMLVVGADDSVAPLMQSDAEQLRALGHTVEFISVPRLAHAWSPHHNDEMWRFLSQHARIAEDVAEPIRL